MDQSVNITIFSWSHAAVSQRCYLQINDKFWFWRAQKNCKLSLPLVRFLAVEPAHLDLSPRLSIGVCVYPKLFLDLTGEKGYYHFCSAWLTILCAALVMPASVLWLRRLVVLIVKCQFLRPNCISKTKIKTKLKEANSPHQG
jgi:hypothetical protein